MATDFLSEAEQYLAGGAQRRAFNSFETAFYNSNLVSGGWVELVERGRAMRDKAEPRWQPKYDDLLSKAEVGARRQAAQEAAQAEADKQAALGQKPVRVTRNEDGVCSYCDTPIAEDARFCEGCGTPVEGVCQSCGATVSAVAQFCSAYCLDGWET